MLISPASATDMAFWGRRTFEGVDFYIEPETDLPEICPFKKPENLPCPHKGLDASTYKKWKPRVYRVGKPDIENFFPTKLAVREDLTFLPVRYLPPKNRIGKLLNCTNAIPLVIYGLSYKDDYQMIFDIARSSKLRPVYIYGDETIPVPSDFKED